MIKELSETIRIAVKDSKEIGVNNACEKYGLLPKTINRILGHVAKRRKSKNIEVPSGYTPISDVAKSLGMSNDSLNAQIKKRNIPTFHFGIKRYFKSDLDVKSYIPHLNVPAGYMTIKEKADTLGTSTTHLRNLIKWNNLKTYVYNDTLYMLDTDDLTSYFEK